MLLVLGAGVLLLGFYLVYALVHPRNSKHPVL